MPMKMPMISKCSVADCAYNSDTKCHALAITVGSSSPLCDTFMKSSEKGGDSDAVGGVGACKVTSCVYNNSLECSSENIQVGMHADHAECDTFQARM